MDNSRTLLTNFFSIFMITLFGLFNLVSSDTDQHQHQIHKDSLSSSHFDWLWRDVVEAAFASPMEWIQLSQALDKVGESGRRRPSTFHLPVGHEDSHPDRKFAYHKVYQTLNTSKIKQSAPTAIAAMFISYQNNHSHSHPKNHQTSREVKHHHEQEFGYHSHIPHSKRRQSKKRHRKKHYDDSSFP